MADPLANQKATLHALFTALNAKDLDGIIAVRTPECLHIVTPESMPGETRTNEQHRAWAQKIMDTMGGHFFTMTITRELHDPALHQAAVYAHAHSPVLPMGTYEADFVLFVRFTQDGTKMAEVLEFMDSKYTSEFHAKMQAFGLEQRKMRSGGPEHMLRARAMPY
ncbi:hypothetical protein LTR53_002869 [Teratosphaeriaceae sp. CCFEE 6253]|nr:hypothetical protein LTR53_002869 [Teratosphaeriaceae sp. CCFEE 6253]